MNKTPFFAISIGCLILTSAMTSVAVAQSNTVAKPNAFLTNMVQTTREQTVANIMRQFRQYAGDDNVLEGNETKKFDAQNVAMNRANAMRRLMQFDHDGNGSISKEELKPKTNALLATSTTYVSRLNKSYEKLDTNKDGSIELIEAYKAMVQKPDILQRNSARSRRLKARNVSNYLDLLPKGQPRKLTADALEKISRDAFAYFDTNGDGVLRGAEQTEWQKERSSARRAQFGNLATSLTGHKNVGTCVMPKPGARDEVFLVALNKTNRQSNISLQGRYSQTGVFNLHIEPGEKPIYAIVHTSKPTIIRLTGDTKRVSHLVNVAGRSGATYEIDKAKVTFNSAIDCFSTFTKNTSGGATLAKSVIKGLIGRRVNRTVATYSMDRLTLPSAVIDKCSSSFETRNAAAYQKLCGMPEWFKAGETATHKAIGRYHPAGADLLQKEKVNADSEIHSSNQYPAYLGMLKLVQDGVAEELDGGGYYIKKQMPEYPAGLSGKLATRFLFAKGITPPEWFAGTSCIEFEDQEAKSNVANDVFCRLFNR